MLLVEYRLHFFLVNNEHRARYGCCGITHANRLTRQTPLTKKVTRPQEGYDRLPAGLAHDGHFNSTFLYIHDAVSGGALQKDSLGLATRCPTIFRCLIHILKRYPQILALGTLHIAIHVEFAECR
jgi:hypothetical protein